MTDSESILQPHHGRRAQPEAPKSDPSTGSQAPEVVGICTTFTRRPTPSLAPSLCHLTISYAIKLGVAFSLNHYNICGLTVQQALESQKIHNDNAPLEHRELDRAWRQRNRTRQRVEVFFKIRKVGMSSFGVDPACYLVRGKNKPETVMTHREKLVVQHTLLKLVAKLGRLMTVYKLGDEVVWGIVSVLDGVIEELLAGATSQPAGNSLALHPVMAALLARFGGYGRPRAALRQSLSLAAS